MSIAKVFKPLSTPVKLSAGETLAEVGTLPTTCYFIESGVVIGHLPKQKGKRQKAGQTTVHRKGTLLFFENNHLNQTVSSNFTALTDCKLLSMDYDKLSVSANEQQEVKDILLSMVCQNSIKAMSYAHDPHNSDLDWCYSNLLTILAEECGETTEEGIIINMPINQTTMANMLNISRTSLYFLCKKLQEQGIITQKKMEVIVASIDDLRRFRGNSKE